jgi:hypothetical protein
MVIINQTQITESTFTKWRSYKVDVEDDGEAYCYYVIPLIDVDQFNVDMLETIPALYSSYSDEFTDDKGNTVYTIRFDTQLPEITTEQEVELLYKILTKKSLITE